MVVFPAAYSARLLLQLCISYRRVGERQRGEEGERGGEISSPPSLSVAEYFVRTASQKPVSSLQ